MEWGFQFKFQRQSLGLDQAARASEPLSWPAAGWQLAAPGLADWAVSRWTSDCLTFCSSQCVTGEWGSAAVGAGMGGTREAADAAAGQAGWLAGCVCVCVCCASDGANRTAANHTKYAADMRVEFEGSGSVQRKHAVDRSSAAKPLARPSSHQPAEHPRPHSSFCAGCMPGCAAAIPFQHPSWA